MVLVGLLVIGVKPHISTKVKTQKGWILKISYQNYSLFYFLFNIYIDNASSAEPWMDKWSHGITVECKTPPTTTTKTTPDSTTITTPNVTITTPDSTTTTTPNVTVSTSSPPIGP